MSTTYKLASSNAIYAPGIFAAMKHQYLRDPEHAVGVVAACWSVPVDVLNRAFKGDNSVVVEIDDEEETVTLTAY